jgi:hypothetical protein
MEPMTAYWIVSRALLVVVLALASVACSGRPAPAPAPPQAAAGSGPALAVAHGAIAAPSPAKIPSTSDAPDDNKATPLAAVWKNRAALAGTTVTVRGKIVKYNGGILGVNWMHVQDGTGSAADRSNDLTVTSETEAKVGDEISATGTIGVNKDIGSGYQYPVILERARIVKR